MTERIETTHPVDTPENAGLLMFAMLHTFVELAHKYPAARVDNEQLLRTARAAIDMHMPDMPIDERELGGVQSGFNACMFRDTCRAVIAERKKWRELLAAVVDQLDNGRDDGNAPGHGHERPGIWDDDNGALAGEPCSWCALWNRAKRELDRATNDRPPPATPTGDGWPMLGNYHLEAIIFAYNEGYSKAYERRELPNPFAENGSQAAAYDRGIRDGKEARKRDDEH